VAESSFVCDNSTVDQTLTCQNLQIRYTTEGQADAMRYVHWLLYKFNVANNL